MNDRVFLLAVLVCLGAGWGITQPLAKIAVSEGYRHMGLVFWQLVIGAVLLGTVALATGRRLPLGRRHLALYALIAAVGTLVPNSAAFQSAVHLPAGILSIVLSLVPMFAFPIALMLRTDRFRPDRFAGLCLGLFGVALIALPEGGLPEAGMILWLPLALVAPLFYAFEGNFVAKWGTAGLDPVQVLLGASILGACVAAPVAWLAGAWIAPPAPGDWGAPELAVLLIGVIHGVVYTVYVWLVGRAGAVFAAQVSYLVTGFGIVWAMAILDERYSGWVWAALAVMFCGLFLVQPRPRVPLAGESAACEDANRS